MTDLAAALARVPSPVGEGGGRWCHPEASGCNSEWAEGEAERHSVDCWWPAFVAARDALAASGERVKALLSGPGVDVRAIPLMAEDPYREVGMDQPALAPRHEAAGVTVEGVVLNGNVHAYLMPNLTSPLSPWEGQPVRLTVTPRDPGPGVTVEGVVADRRGEGGYISYRRGFPYLWVDHLPIEVGQPVTVTVTPRAPGPA